MKSKKKTFSCLCSVCLEHNQKQFAVYFWSSWTKTKSRVVSNQIKSNHFYCHITTAQVPWWVKFLWACSRQCRKTTDNLPMDRQCKKNNKQFTYGQTVQKKQQTIYIWTDSAKKTTNNLHMDRQCKKNNKQFTYGQTVQKKQQTIYIWTDSAKKQQQFTYGQYIFTDCTEDNVQNTHTYTQYT